MPLSVFLHILAIVLALISAYLGSIKNQWWGFCVVLAMLCTILANYFSTAP